jgi:hypothetical protein
MLLRRTTITLTLTSTGKGCEQAPQGGAPTLSLTTDNDIPQFVNVIPPCYVLCSERRGHAGLRRNSQRRRIYPWGILI